MNLDALLLELAACGVRIKLIDHGRMSVSAPKGGLSGELRQQMIDHKPALIEWLQRNRHEEKTQALPEIVPDPEHRHDPFPMAELQASFYVGQNEDMEYHVRPHFYVEKDIEDIDVDRLEAALNAVLHQQRYNFPLLGADLQLRVPRALEPIKLSVNDLRHLSEAAAQDALLDLRAAMSRETLPLDRWPTEDFRVSLYGQGRARLHFNHNNFFGDGLGTTKLLRRVFDQYRSPRELPELKLTFRDCVLALQKLENTQPGETSRRYWEDRLLALPGPPPIPLMTGRNARSRSFLSHRKIKLAAPIWKRFKLHAGRWGLTPSNAMTAAYAEVISQWSGSRHYLLNHMVTHRFPMHPEITEIYGNFASLYPLEVDWREAGSFGQRAQRLQERVMNDMRHLHWSGMKVLQALNQVQKTPGRAPCPFVVGSGLFIQDWEDLSFSCLETPQVLLDCQFFEPEDGNLLVALDLIESFFPPGLIDGLQQGLVSLLERLAAQEAAWSEVSFDLLPSAQRELRVLVNRVHAPSREGLLHGGLEANAMAHREKLAVAAGGRALTYAQLNRAANRLARCLLAAGAKPNQLIAILHDKGVEQVVAVFGILTSGAAYVPVDPRWPQERIQFLLENTGANIVVTSRTQRLPTLSQNVHVVYVDPADLAHLPDSPLPVAQSQDDLAYVIFTSGSTGVPKGVAISHRGALNTVMDINKRLNVGDGDVLFGVSSLSFDLSVYDLFGAISAGATLVLPESGDDPDPVAWMEAVTRHEVTVWNSVPALMQLLVDAAVASRTLLPSLQLVMMSGDWIPVGLPDQIRRSATNARIVSLGGATEASIWSIHYLVDQVDLAWASIPYGKPLANQAWHVLGENGEDAPTWVAGNLHIAGDGLALGYWGDEQKTNASFVPHPRTGERLYRTGDLGRYLPDGNIEFLGRADTQVKIQGYRIELGEIEAVLSQHPDVRAAAVIAHPTQGGKQLTAFVVASAGSSVDPAVLYDHLRGKIPAYTVPSHIVPIERLPLAANGKIDRAALQKPSPLGASKQSVAARSEVEKELVAIWEEVLAVKNIGVEEDFFDLGGQSFAAIRVMTRIAQRYGRRLALSALLEGRTIAALARDLRVQQAWSPLVQLCGEGAGAPCFFVHPAGGNVLCYRGLAERLGRRFYGLQAPGLTGEQPALDRVEAMATLYVEAMREVQPQGPYLLGGWSSGGMIAFEMASQLEALGEQVDRVVMIDALAPMRNSAVDDANLLLWFLEDLDIGIDLGQARRRGLDGGIQQALQAALASVSMRQTRDIDLDAEQLAHVLAVFSGVLLACRRYRPDSIDADISVLRATEGNVGGFADHPATAAGDGGWSRFTRGAVTTIEIPGTHYTIFGDRHIAGLAQRLGMHLRLCETTKQDLAT